MDADTSPVNIYDVSRASGGFEEIEADFYERADDSWVFIAGGQEVFRILLADVEGITKSRMSAGSAPSAGPEVLL